MRIGVYSLCYNEEVILPYFLRHYRQFAAQIKFFDNHSTDSSRNILAAGGAVIELYDSGNEIRDDIYLKIKNNCWKADRDKFDWVMVVDADEFVFHEHMIEFLTQAKSRGVAVCVPRGFDMVHDRLPTTTGQLYEEANRGQLSPLFAKSCVFDPKKVKDINFGPGCHAARPVGFGSKVTQRRERALKLLHFQALSADYVVARFKNRAQRISRVNRKHGWGRHYLADELVLRRKHRQKLAQASVVV